MVSLRADARSNAARRILAELDQELAKIAAVQKADKSLRCPVEAFDDVLAVFELAAAQQRGRHGAIFAETLPLVADDEALDLEAFADCRHQIGAGPRLDIIV